MNEQCTEKKYSFPHGDPQQGERKQKSFLKGKLEPLEERDCQLPCKAKCGWQILLVSQPSAGQVLPFPQIICPSLGWAMFNLRVSPKCNLREGSNHDTLSAKELYFPSPLSTELPAGRMWKSEAFGWNIKAF